MDVFVLFFHGWCIVGVNGQVGMTNCDPAAATDNCPNFLPNTKCGATSSKCDCLTGYIKDSLDPSISCTYECGILATPTNGAVDTSGGTTTGSVATFSCANTYMLSGAATSTCVNGTGWHNTATACVPVELGDSCVTNIFACDNIANGQCEAFTSCECLTGYENDGTRLACSDINDCATDPCQNGGTCVDEINAYSCNCVDGYTDTNCQTEIDECAEDPCQNGGTCTDGINMYSCDCVAGYNGDDCENNIDECTPDPCQNGATCVDGINQYTCSCVAGYNGNNCQNNIDECIGKASENGASKVDGINEYTCNCVDGYDRDLCENKISTEECNFSTWPIIISVVLAFTNLILLVYAGYATILIRRNKANKDGLECNIPMRNQMYVNVADAGGSNNVVSDREPEYTGLDDNTREDRTRYDIVQSSR